MALLAVDIGNSNILLAIRQPTEAQWSSTWRLSSRPDQTADEWYSAIAPHLERFDHAPTWSRVVACSVVPALTTSFVEFSRHYLGLEPLIVTASLDLGLIVKTEQPHETGTDRIVNAAAAFADLGGPVVIVDAGTATKIDIVTGDGKFLGGAIAPGLGLAMDSLARHAAQLKTVPMSPPERAIGENTTQAVQSGVILGHAKMIDGMVRQISSEVGGAGAVVMTGGFSGLIAARCETVTHHRPNLTLDGLALIAGRNP
jgi:type III pantothenate kinase